LQCGAVRLFCNATPMDEHPGTDIALSRPLLPGISCHAVLCWVGSDDEEDVVVEVAAALAQRSGGRCQVVMGLDSPHRFKGDTPATPLTPEVIARAERRLARLYGPTLRTMVLPGHPVAEVRRYARNHKVDLIVMGNQALDVEQSYGERLHERAPCPIMILLKPVQER
jgi:nucleotide-binding universal stress UspA family protein